MRVAAWFALLLLVAISSGYCQQHTWSPLPSMAVDDLDRVSLDNYGRIFYADTKGNVFKIDRSGEIISQYSPPIQGRLTQLDAFSTLVLFLFSADLQQATLLDHHLAPIQHISFHNDAIGLVKAAALGNNHVFWLFDEMDLSLKKYDYRRGHILQVQPLFPVIGGDRIEVVEILERDNLVLLNVKDRGLWVFDNQGNFIKRHEVELTQPLAVYNGQAYYLKGSDLFRLNIHSGEERVYMIPDLSGDGLAVSAELMLIYSSKSLFPFRMPVSD